MIQKEGMIKDPDTIKSWMWSSERQPSNRIYVFECGGYFKIGVCRNVRARIKNLECTNPHPVSVEYYVACEKALQVEKETHKRLKEKRHRNEWFTCTKEEAIAMIETVAKEMGEILTPKTPENHPWKDTE